MGQPEPENRELAALKTRIRDLIAQSEYSEHNTNPYLYTPIDVVRVRDLERILGDDAQK